MEQDLCGAGPLGQGAGPPGAGPLGYEKWGMRRVRPEQDLWGTRRVGNILTRGETWHGQNILYF